MRCDDAAIAAADGSSDDDSWTVGDRFFGADPRKSFLVENLRDRLDPSFFGSISAGGVVMGCSGLGKGCERSLNMRMTGSVSSRSFLFSSNILSKCSLITLISASAARIRWSRRRIDSMTRAMSSCVAVIS